MVLLETHQLLLQGLHLHLQVGLAQGQLVQDPAQAIGVGLHQLSQTQLRLIPVLEHGQPLRAETKYRTQGQPGATGTFPTVYENNRILSPSTCQERGLSPHPTPHPIPWAKLTCS